MKSIKVKEYLLRMGNVGFIEYDVALKMAENCAELAEEEMWEKSIKNRESEINQLVEALQKAMTLVFLCTCTTVGDDSRNEFIEKVNELLKICTGK